MPTYLDTFFAPIRDSQANQVLIMALFIGIAVDVILGVASAALRCEIKSRKMREGAMHKLAEVGLVIVADILDGMLMGGLMLTVAPVLPSTVSFLALMELFSICENCVKMNPDFAQVPLIGQIAKLLHDAKENPEAKENPDA